MTSAALIKPALRVGIVGAGIGGLSLALALREPERGRHLSPRRNDLTAGGRRQHLHGVHRDTQP